MEDEPKGYDYTKDIARLIEATGAGVSSAMDKSANRAKTSGEIKEAKKRTFADVLSNALKRKRKMHEAKEEQDEELTGDKAKGIQQVASHFANKLHTPSEKMRSRKNVNQKKGLKNVF